MYPFKSAWHSLPDSGWANPTIKYLQKAPVFGKINILIPTSIYPFKASSPGLPVAWWVNPKKKHWKKVTGWRPENASSKIRPPLLQQQRYYLIQPKRLGL